MTPNNTYPNSIVATQPTFKTHSYFQLLKFRLSALVVFSGAFGYIMAVDMLLWPQFVAFLISSFLVTGSANTINQIIEKDLDKLMRRTALRPLPTGGLSVKEAIWFSTLLGIIGIGSMAYFVNPLSAALSAISLLLYAFFYTPLKQVTPLAVLVGAFPGALPPLIGWAAGANSLSFEAFVFFGVQFLWQFPHFWAIAWVGFDDYKRAGFFLLPSRSGKSLQSSIQIIIYTMLLIPTGLLPYMFGATGVVSATIVTIAGMLFLAQTIVLTRSLSDKDALRIMFASFLYLPIVQISWLFDKL